jgi:endogenous inhibitor of DNA gyrase (YacG/DUF329 family)
MDSEADEKGMTIVLMTGNCSTCHKAMQYLENCIYFLEHISDVPVHSVKCPTCMFPDFLQRVPNSWTDLYLKEITNI